MPFCYTGFISLTTSRWLLQIRCADIEVMKFKGLLLFILMMDLAFPVCGQPDDVKPRVISNQVAEQRKVSLQVRSQTRTGRSPLDVAQELRVLFGAANIRIVGRARKRTEMCLWSTRRARESHTAPVSAQ